MNATYIDYTMLCPGFANAVSWPIQFPSLGLEQLTLSGEVLWLKKWRTGLPLQAAPPSELLFLKDSNTSATCWLKAREPLRGANDWASLHSLMLTAKSSTDLPTLAAGSACLIIYTVMDGLGIVCPSNSSPRTTVSPGFICGFFPVMRKAFHSVLLETGRESAALSRVPNGFHFEFKKYANFWVPYASHKLPTYRNQGRDPSHNECFSG